MSIIGDSHHMPHVGQPTLEGGRVVTCAATLIECLTSITSMATAAPTVETVLAALVHHGAPLALRSTVLWNLEGEHLRLVTAHGYEPHDLERFGWLPVNAHVPCSDAVIEDRAVICPDRAEMFRCYPLVERLVTGTQALVSLPVHRNGMVVAAMSIHFSAPIQADEYVRRFLESVSDLVGLVYDDRPVAEVLPLAALRMARAIDDDPALLHGGPGEGTDTEDTPTLPGSLWGRLEALERQMRNMRQVLMFLGAIANDRLDDGF